MVTKATIRSLLFKIVLICAASFLAVLACVIILALVENAHDDYEVAAERRSRCPKPVVEDGPYESAQYERRFVVFDLHRCWVDLAHLQPLPTHDSDYYLATSLEGVQFEVRGILGSYINDEQRQWLLDNWWKDPDNPPCVRPPDLPPGD